MAKIKIHTRAPVSGNSTPIYPTKVTVGSETLEGVGCVELRARVDVDKRIDQQYWELTIKIGVDPATLFVTAGDGR